MEVLALAAIVIVVLASLAREAAVRISPRQGVGGFFMEGEGSLDRVPQRNGRNEVQG